MSALPDARPDAQGEAHLDDAVLLRALDGELLPEDGAADAHLAACAGCSARAARLGARRGRLSALLAATDVPVPALLARPELLASPPVLGPAPKRAGRERPGLARRPPERRAGERRTPVGSAAVRPARERRVRGRRTTDARTGAKHDATQWAATPAYVTPAAIHVVPGSRPGARRGVGARAGTRLFARTGARLAAAGVLVAAAGLAAQPVRRWVAERWAELAAPATSRPPAGVALRQSAFDTAAPAAPPPVVVAFTPDRAPAGEPFTLRFDERPAGGTLTVRVATGARATAVAHPEKGGRAGEFVVLPAGLRVRNAAAPHGRYELTVPAGTDRLRVTFGAPPSDTVLALGGAAPVVLPLRAP